MLSISNLIAATVRVSITSVQASSVENAGGITRSSLHSWVTSPPAPRQVSPPPGPGSESWGPPHCPSPGPHLQVLLCASAPRSRLDAFPQAKSAPGHRGGRGSTLRGKALLAADTEVEEGETRGSNADGDRAASMQSHKANPHLVQAPRTSSQRLCTSGAFGAWEEHMMLTATGPREHPRAPPAFRLLRASQLQQQQPSQAKAVQNLQEVGRDSHTAASPLWGCLERAAR